jgi:cyclase
MKSFTWMWLPAYMVAINSQKLCAKQQTTYLYRSLPAEAFAHWLMPRIYCVLVQIKDPQLITDISRRYGAQCCVVSIQAKKNVNGWDAYYDIGRENSGRSVVDWAQEAVELGAGEILLTSIDREGTRKGFDLALIEAVSSKVSVPVIASGGLGSPEHAAQAFKSGADAVAVAYALHYGITSIQAIKEYCRNAGIPLR